MNSESDVPKRVGAIVSMKNGIAEIFGFGIFLGDYIPEDDIIGPFGINLKEAKIKNPKIQLDSGEIVWGCECWWGPEDVIQAKLSTAKEVKIIAPAEYRKQIAK